MEACTPESRGAKAWEKGRVEECDRRHVAYCNTVMHTSSSKVQQIYARDICMDISYSLATGTSILPTMLLQHESRNYARDHPNAEADAECYNQGEAPRDQSGAEDIQPTATT